MANEVTIRVTAKDDASKVFGAIDQKAQGLGGTLSKVGAIAGGFLAANVIAGAGQKLTNFLGDSVKAASDLGESINAVNVIFGDSAQEILAWGKTSATQAGLSQRAFNQLATPLGALLKNTGKSMDEVAKDTINLTKRAADMASVFNTDVEDALTAIQAALRGEADPIERYGVALNAAKVEAEAFAMTGKSVASSLTDQEKAAARLSLIFKQTEDVANDFTNTSDQLANSQRIAAARTEELQAQIGEKLIPVTMKLTELKLALVTVLAEKVIPALEELYAKHWPAVSKAIQDVVAVIEEWWPKLQPIFAFVFEDVKTRIEAFFQQMQGIVQVVQGVADLVRAVIEGDWRAAWEALNTIVEGAITLVIGTIRGMFGELADQMFQIGKDIMDGLIDGVKSKLNDLENIFKSITDKIPKLKGPIEKDRRLLEPIGQAIMQGLADGLSSGFTRAVNPVLSGAAPATVGAFGSSASSAAATQHASGVGGNGGFAFNVHQMTIYEKDDRDIRDLAFGVQAALATDLRRRGVLRGLGSTGGATNGGLSVGGGSTGGAFG